MENFIEQLLSADPLAICMVIWVVARLILGVFELVATRNTQSLKKSLLEVQTFMSKFRLPDYQETDPKAKKANMQSFTPYTDKYVYNEDTKILSKAINPETGEILQRNDQDYIDSFASTAFDKVLERFLPQDYAKVVSPLSDDQMSEDIGTPRDLTDYASILDHAETLRQKYGLDSDMSCIDVFNFVDDLNKQYKSKLDGYYQAKAEISKNVEQPQVAPAKVQHAEMSSFQQAVIDYDKLAQAILNKQSKEVK